MIVEAVIRHPTRDRGFALVVTLSLMILLTVIAVGLLTLSSASLRNSSSELEMGKARANARLAVILALGELQKQTGADTRVTARADLLWYLTNQKPHGAKNGTAAMLDIILNQYGGHAKPVIPQLEKAAEYLATEYKSEEMAKQVRATIKSIESAPTPLWQMTSIAEYLK